MGLGLDLLDDRNFENDRRFIQLLQGAHLVDTTINRGVVVPMPLISARLTFESPSDSSLRLGHLRGLDALSYSPKGVGRGMPPFILALMVSAGAVILLINPSDYIGEIKGIITASSVYVLYWLSQRSKRKEQQSEQNHQTAEEVFKFSTDKERRLEERESKLRQEEREFMHGQIELSRQRGHILARGYMALEMANDQLIEILQKKNIEVPTILLTQTTRAQVLGELKEVEEKQAAITETQTNKQ